MAPINFGILMLEYQTLDVAGPLDILSCCSTRIIQAISAAGLPTPSPSSGIDIKFHHINTTMEPVPLSSGFITVPSTTCDDCPPLDYLIVGGPETFEVDERFKKFIRDHVESGKTLFTTCSGAMAVAQAGVLDGKMATTNHVFLLLAGSMAPGVNWVKEQWVIDGNIWTAGGASAGMDMLAHWVVENYGLEVAKFGFEALDFEPRDIKGVKLFLKE